MSFVSLLDAGRGGPQPVATDGLPQELAASCPSPPTDPQNSRGHLVTPSTPSWRPALCPWWGTVWGHSSATPCPPSLPPRPLASTVNDKLELQECLEHGRIAKVSQGWGLRG